MKKIDKLTELEQKETEAKKNYKFYKSLWFTLPGNKAENKKRWQKMKEAKKEWKKAKKELKQYKKEHKNK